MTNDAPSPTSATAERPFQFRLLHLIVAIAIVGAMLALLNSVRNAREAARRSACSGRLYQVALALRNYHDTYAHFPPAYQCDQAGKRVHSWRLLILPFLEQRPLYDRYDFAEPWNGPSNSRLHAANVQLFRCYSDETSPGGMTNYVAIVGNDTLWPAPDSTSMNDLGAGVEHTLMLAEISHSNIHWMEPRDLPIEELDEWLDPTHRPRLFGNHIEGGMVAYADGRVEILPRDVTIERLRALASRAGKDGEVARETKP